MNTQELLWAADMIRLATLSPHDAVDYNRRNNRRKVRLWVVDAVNNGSRTVVVRTEGGVKGEAKKAARRVGLEMIGAGAGATSELWLNTLSSIGLEHLCGCDAVSLRWDLAADAWQVIA